MVEMLETKDALNKATPHSLILLDEIGRGTSTYDGMALAQAIIEYIYKSIGAKTLFSTHYHELTSLAETIPNLRNVHVSAAEENGTVVFLHQVIEGAADRSYGVYVAELAGLPKHVTTRAEQLLQTLETSHGNRGLPTTQINGDRGAAEEVAATITDEPQQLSLFEPEVQKQQGQELNKKEKELLTKIMETDLLHLTPFQALEKIDQWQKQLKRK